MTPERLHEMQQEVVVWLTMLSDPRSYSNIEAVNEQARRTVELNPPLAFIMVSSFAASRFTMARDLHRTKGSSGELLFPREELTARPFVTETTVDVVSRCVDLVGGMVRGLHDDEALRETLAAGPAAFLTLGGIAVRMGQCVVELDPTLETLADLIAREGVEAEREYLETLDGPS
jgi:hypothetical protein